jgi:hypothetical protein
MDKWERAVGKTIDPTDIYTFEVFIEDVNSVNSFWNVCRE